MNLNRRDAVSTPELSVKFRRRTGAASGGGDDCSMGELRQSGFGTVLDDAATGSSLSATVARLARRRSRLGMRGTAWAPGAFVVAAVASAEM